MRVNKKRYLIILLALLMLINVPIITIAESNIDLSFNQEGSKLTVNIKGERNRPVSITIQDDAKYYYIDQGTTNESGRVSFSTRLDGDKTYQCKVNIDGQIAEKNIKMKSLPLPEPDPNPEDPNVPKDPDRPDDKNMGSLYIRGYKGVILNKSNIEIKTDESALEFTERLLNKNKIDYKIKSGYISEIDGQGEFDKGPGSGWMFSVNGKYPNVGANIVKLKPGDSISWLYTYDLGEDIGNSSLDSGGKDDQIKNPEIEDSLNIIKDKTSKESEIEKAIDNMVKYFTDEKSKLNSKEIEKLLKEAKEASETLFLGIDRIKTEKLAVNIGNNAIKITKALDRLTKDHNDLDTLKNLAEISRENMGIALSTIGKIENKVNINTIIDDILKTSMGIESRLSEKTINPNKNIGNTIGINIIGEKNSSGKIMLPELLLKKALKESFDSIKLFSDSLSMEIVPDFLNLDTQEDINIDINSTSDKISIKLKQGNKRIKETKKPIKLILSCNKKIENEDNITTLMILEDGTQELLGGRYNTSERAMKFLSYKIGEYKIIENPVSFDDTIRHPWAKKSIDSMASKGIIQGRTDENFDPAANITRAEFSTLIVRTLKLNDNMKNDLTFKDVPKDKWYYKSISTIFENGLVSGRSKDVFDPEGNITREEMTKIIGQILESNLYKKQDEKTLDSFQDLDGISNWAKSGAVISVYNKVIQGDNGKFMPNEDATRAETAVILSRLYGLIME